MVDTAIEIISDEIKEPIGPFAYQGTPDERLLAFAQFAALPLQLRLATQGLSDEELNTPYRPGGWSLRQLVHHLADVEMMAWVRIKMALDRDQVAAPPFDVNSWAAMPDKEGAIEPSLRLIDGLHVRYSHLLSSLPEAHWQRAYHHQLWQREVTIAEYFPRLAWHARHHTAQIVMATLARRSAANDTVGIP
jgi:uncharacterized damage-inducible protein DinB